MNKSLKILFGLLLSVFLVGNINAQSMYSQTETLASEYADNNLNIKANYQRYLKVVDDNSKFYKKGNPEKLYSLGGLLSYEEFKITTKNRNNNYILSDEYANMIVNLNDGTKITIREYFGTYNGCSVMFIDTPWWGYMDSFWSEEVAGYTFGYGSSQTLDVYRNGEFVSLKEAYEKGWLSKKDIKDIRYYYAIL